MKHVAYTSHVGLQERSDCVQKKEAKNWQIFRKSLSEKPWCNVERACICALFWVYSGEWARKAIGNRLQQPCYLSRDDHDKEHI